MYHFPYPGVGGLSDEQRGADSPAAIGGSGAGLRRLDMEWAKPEFKRQEINRAGQAIARPDGTDEGWQRWIDAMPIVNNWRSAHSYPLNSFQINLRARARKVQAKPLVSQRLKRLDSIVRKLVRDQTSTMQLSQMQDIGGCRAVLDSNKEVYTIATTYREGGTKKWLHELVGAGKDYIESPKKDGYRSVHLIFRYIGPPTNAAWNNLKIEMQLRSSAQHSWATALEAVDIFTNQALKANRGDQNWQRFFALMGSFIARSERRPPVPDTPYVGCGTQRRTARIGDAAKRHASSSRIWRCHTNGTLDRRPGCKILSSTSFLPRTKGFLEDVSAF